VVIGPGEQDDYEGEDEWEDVDEEWESGGFRGWVNDHPVPIVAIAVVFVLIGLSAVTGYLSEESEEAIDHGEKGWFYDLNTGKLFVGNKDAKVPIKAPSGPLADGKAAGVRAYVLSYSSKQRPSKSERFIGFLETVDPKAKGGRRKNSGARKAWAAGKLIRKVDDEEWVSADGAEGQELLKEVFAVNESGERPHYVWPK
jgi:hypothetical protein